MTCYFVKYLILIPHVFKRQLNASQNKSKKKKKYSDFNSTGLLFQTIQKYDNFREIK